MRFLIGIVIDADDETDARDFANQLQAGIRSARAAGRTPILGIVQGPTVSPVSEPEDHGSQFPRPTMCEIGRSAPPRSPVTIPPSPREFSWPRIFRRRTHA